MRIQILSDLHRDVIQSDIRLASGADVLVMAGDVCQGIDRAMAYLRSAVPKPTPIIFVAGNHEHYSHAIGKGLERGRAAAADLGIAFLENDAAVIGGVRFLGCTLWTDYALDGEAQRLNAMQHAADGMNDHRHISLTKHPWVRFSPAHALAIHRVSRDWLESVLDAPFDGPTVIVTHHAPSCRSVHPRYAGSPVNAAFASSLDGLVAASGAALWVHGHTHTPFNYRIGGTRVLCNPHGYGAENHEFDPALVVRV